MVEKGVSLGEDKYLEFGYNILDGCWRDLVLAEKELNAQYVDGFQDDSCDGLMYSIDLGSLDGGSHPATIGLALPVYFEMLADKEETLDEITREADLDPDDYGSGEILPKES